MTEIEQILKDLPYKKMHTVRCRNNLRHYCEENRIDTLEQLMQKQEDLKFHPMLQQPNFGPKTWKWFLEQVSYKSSVKSNFLQFDHQ